MTTNVLDLWPQAAGYAYAVFLAQVPIWRVIDRMWSDVGIPSVDRPRHWHSKLLGVVERTLFVASLQMAKPEFIGVWLALKVAGQWQQWSEDKPYREGGPTIVGRQLFNIFLIGNALSITYAVVGAQAIGWLAAHDWTLGLGMPLLLLAASWALSIAVEKYTQTTGTPSPLQPNAASTRPPEKRTASDA